MQTSGKSEGLKSMQEVGITIPPTVTLDSHYQKEFFRVNNLLDLCDEFLSQGIGPYEHAVARLKKSTLIMPGGIVDVFKELQPKLEYISKMGIVRSAASIEDSDEYAFAGIFSSLPFVLNKSTSFYRALAAVWLSSLKQHVIEYIKATGSSINPKVLSCCMNIIIQPYIPSSASGVLFSTSMEDPSRAKVYANYGLGELLNTLNTHQCELIETNTTFKAENITGIRFGLWLHSKSFHLPGDILNAKKCDLVVSLSYKSHISQVRFPKTYAKRPCLNKNMREELFLAYKKILSSRGKRDFEFEFVFDESKLYVVQIRPITAYNDHLPDGSTLKYIVSGEMHGPIQDFKTAKDVMEGSIIAVRNLTYDLVSILNRVSGILTVYGTPHSHAAIVCRELEKPVAIISEDQFRRIKRGDLKFVDGSIVDEL